MNEYEIINAATNFVKADVEYVRLIQSVIDFKTKGRCFISPQELRALKLAKAKKATLEEQMYKVWEGATAEP